MIQRNFSLKAFNTFGLSVNAHSFATFSGTEELQAILTENASQKPLFILGGGSNVLFTKDVDALVVRNEIIGIEIVSETETTINLKVGAGEVWHQFVRYTVENNWGGIENLSLIPGSVGASPMQNIGAYGVELKDVFVSLEAFHIATQEIHTFSGSDCAFGYRESVFKRKLKDQYIITHVTFKLAKQPIFNTAYGAIQDELNAMGISELSVDAVSQAVMNIRRSKLPDPTVLGNAGSFFKNPVIESSILTKLMSLYPTIPHYPQPNGTEKLAAGWLIEQTGWKGKRVGNCGVHEKQALVLVNYGGASGNDIYSLSQAILDAVNEKFGVVLEREVNIW